MFSSSPHRFHLQTVHCILPSPPRAGLLPAPHPCHLRTPHLLPLPPTATGHRPPKAAAHIHPSHGRACPAHILEEQKEGVLSQGPYHTTSLPSSLPCSFFSASFQPTHTHHPSQPGQDTPLRLSPEPLPTLITSCRATCDHNRRRYGCCVLRPTWTSALLGSRGLSVFSSAMRVSAS